MASITLFTSSFDNSAYIGNETQWEAKYSELGKLNEILEREINLLKSLILINNLNSTNNERENDQRQNYNKNYFIEMCNDNNLQELGKDDGLFKKHKTLHTLMMKIKVK